MTQKTAWDTEKELGLAGVDAEHRLQTRLVAVFRGALAQGRDSAVVSEILDRIEATTSVHFMSEELLMRQHAYEGYEAHVAEHQRMLEQLAAIRAGIAAGQGGLASAAERIEAWLEGHIRGMDRRFVESLSAPPPQH